MIDIRRKQSEIWEELLRFETRILYKLLPLELNQVESYIAPNISPPTLNNPSAAIQLKNKRYQIIQEAKRQWLDVSLNAYQLQLEEYEQEYETEFSQFQAHLSTVTTTVTNTDRSCVLEDIHHYVTHQTGKFKQDIYRRLSGYQRNLVQRRHHSRTAKETVGVSPEPHLDLLSNPFTQREWDYLSLGKRIFLKQRRLQWKNASFFSSRSILYQIESKCYSS